VRLLRRAWPRELSETVDAASRAATGRKEEILAAVQLTDNHWVAGTRAAIYLPTDAAHTPENSPPAAGSGGGASAPGPDGGAGGGGGAGVAVRRVGWEKVERANWDSEASILYVYETTDFGTPLRATELKVEDPGRFGQLLRERVDASIVVQRHVILAGKRGVRVVGRRNPATTDAPVSWNFVLDKGLEPTQPGVLDAAEAALREVRDEFGI
jgi:hypothetical protein